MAVQPLAIGALCQFGEGVLVLRFVRKKLVDKFDRINAELARDFRKIEIGDFLRFQRVMQRPLRERNFESQFVFPGFFGCGGKDVERHQRCGGGGDSAGLNKHTTVHKTSFENRTVIGQYPSGKIGTRKRKPRAARSGESSQLCKLRERFEKSGLDKNGRELLWRQ